jgi:hypothetical protein
MRSAGAGEWLKKDLLAIVERLGEFPHGRLSLPVRTGQKAAKRPGAKCAKCGYEVVMLKKHLLLGPPICPKDMEGMDRVRCMDLYSEYGKRMAERGALVRVWVS